MSIHLLEINTLREEPTHRDLVADDEVSNLDRLLRLLQCFLVPVKLGEYCAELQAEPDFQL